MRSNFRPRRSIVTFRLSDDEYELVKRGSEDARSRSLSDYARDAVLRRVAMEREPKEAELSVITANMDRLGEAMREMDGKLSQILRQTELNH
ncbi:MAG: hypothetical protein K7J47_18220 [Acidobacteria bacterium]|jgi:hypothetical protein|nr:hypothetical protein [Bryobacteraceae bacterium CoA2 C42]MCA2962724.1 hypothetical protein [Acidobacteriaceae bacterium]